MLRRIILALAITLSLAACQLGDVAEYTQAVREAPTSPVDARSYVNGLRYSYGEPAPALEAFRAVTADRNWPAGNAERWIPFVTNVMAGESGFCPNVRGGAIMSGDGCEIIRQGRRSDSGFGQVISVHYKYPNGWLCRQEGLCSSAAIIATPYASMTALVALIERSGGQPWCFSRWARRYHNCSLVP